jgi:DNA repair protein RadC
MAIFKGVASIITAHNHPSGSLTASNEDLKFIRQIKDAGLIIDIKMLDNVILTKEGHWSANEEGII